MDFIPSFWTEAPAPPEFAECSLCELHRQRKRVIWGEGNPNAKLVLLLDNPGAREDAEGRPFVCGTRQTLQQAASEVGLTEQDVFMTYVLKCRPVRAYDKPVCRAACLQRHGFEQLRAMKPLLVFCFGNAAVQAFWNDEEVDVKSLRGGIHEVNGYAAAVTYHPLAVRRRPNLYRLFLEDWALAESAFRMRKRQMEQEQSPSTNRTTLGPVDNCVPVHKCSIYFTKAVTPDVKALSTFRGS